MSTQQSVEHFLYETFGYRIIDDFVRRNEKYITFKSYLDGTILGTFGARSSVETTTDTETGIVRVPVWKRRYIIVPHIFPASELEEQIETGKRYLAELLGEDVLGPEIRSREFFLSSFTAFVRYTGREVREKFGQIYQKNFPEADYQFNVRGRFRGHIKDEGFYLFTDGSNSQSGAKLVVVSFNLPDEVVKNINEISESYNRLMRIGEDKK